MKRRGRPPKVAVQLQSRAATPRRSKRNEITVNSINLNKIKTFNSFNLFTFLLVLISLAIFGLKLVNCHKVNHQVKFCDTTSNMPVWDERDECHLPKIDEAKVDHSPFIILSKMHDLVNGDGWQCYKTIHSYEYTESIAWTRSKSSEVTSVHLKRRECKQMIDSKMCGDNKMTCENSNCWFTPTVTPDYKWWDTVTVKVESCKFHPKTIVAKDLKTSLFGTRCLPEDLECNLHDSIVVWEKNILHESPFNKIFQEIFSHSANLVWSDRLHVLFQTTEQHTYCNLQMWETREGLFILPTAKITSPQLQHLSGILANIDQKALTDLQLSDSDYYELKNIKMIERLNRKICKLFKADLEVFRLSDNKFIRLRDDNNNPLILFSSNNAINVPTCVDVNDFFIKSQTEFCYRDIPVSFQLEEKEINGYLTEELILIKSSSHVPCTDITKTIRFPALKLTVTINDNKIKTEHVDFRSVRVNPKMKNFIDLNFHHSQQVIDGINSIENAQVFLDGEETLIVERNTANNSREVKENRDHSWSNNVLQTLKIIGSIVTSLIVLSLLILAITCITPITKSVNTLIDRFRTKNSLRVNFNKRSNDVKLEAISPIDQLHNIEEIKVDKTKQNEKNIACSTNYLDRYNSKTP